MLGALKYFNNRPGEQCCLQGGRVLVVRVGKWLKNKCVKRQQARCFIKVEWRFDQGYVCNFRRVVRVLAQTACRANSQSGKH